MSPIKFRGARQQSPTDSAPQSPGPQAQVLQAASDPLPDHPRDHRLAPGESAPWVVRTALCVEPRDDRLHLFVPPLPVIEDYLDLIAAIEDAAADLQCAFSAHARPLPPTGRRESFLIPPQCDMQSSSDSLQSNRSSEL